MRSPRLFVPLLLAFACAMLAAPAAEAKSSNWAEQTGATIKVVPGQLSASTPATKKSRRPKKGDLRVEKTGTTVSSLQPSDFDEQVGPPIRRLDRLDLRSRLVIYS